jgi:cytidine deaminase
MNSHKYEFEYEVLEDAAELNTEDAALLSQARTVTQHAYAPYSRFYVGAVARLNNGQIISGTNQENASYPVGICAERVLLGNAATMFPNAAINTLAISYRSDALKSDHPISPCGMCRQALLEYERRQGAPMRLLLAGQEGRVYIVTTVRSLLPLAFTSEELF